MKKILISDFIGTLVPDDIERAEYQCGYGDLLNTSSQLSTILDDQKYSNKILDKMIVLLDRNLKDFLESGNIIKIVTSDAGHCEGIDYFLNSIVPRFKSLKQYTGQLEIWFSDISTDANMYFLGKVNLFEENGHVYFIHNNIKFGVLNKKEDIFNIVLDQYNLGNVQLYALGNDFKDIMMLIRCMELGGKSALIKQNLYTYQEYLNKSITHIIGDKAHTDYLIMVENLALKKYPNFSTLNYLEKRNIIKTICNEVPYDKWVEERKETLYKLLLSQQLDINEIFEEAIVYEMLNYSYCDELRYRLFSPNKYDKLRVYSTFRQFKTKVLGL